MKHPIDIIESKSKLIPSAFMEQMKSHYSFEVIVDNCGYPVVVKSFDKKVIAEYEYLSNVRKAKLELSQDQISFCDSLVLIANESVF